LMPPLYGPVEHAAALLRLPKPLALFALNLVGGLI